MKTTVEIPDALIAEAQRIAQRDRTTLRALVEEGLRRAIDGRLRRSGFTLRDAAVDGEGLNGDFAGGAWDRIRDATYEGRGA